MRPGTDLPLALAVIRWLFENGRADEAFLAAHATGGEELRRRAAPWTLERAAEASGVPAAAIERLRRALRRRLAGGDPLRLGLERNRNGGSAVAAVLALPAVAGKFGVRGGGYTLSNGGAWSFGREAAIGEPEPPTRDVNMNLLGAALLDYDAPPVEALFVYNSNPLATTPDQERVRAGLEREDLFTVVFEQVMTDTALYADVLLPATAFLEHRELARGYGACVIHRIEPVAEAPGEARPNYEVFAELIRRLGLARPATSRIPTRSSARCSAPRREPRRPRRRWTRRDRDAPRGPRPVQFVDSFPRTPDRKAHLVPPDLDPEAPLRPLRLPARPGDGGRPLALISPATNRTISCTLGHLRRGRVPLEMHPADAAARGLPTATGARVERPTARSLLRCA